MHTLIDTHYKKRDLAAICEKFATKYLEPKKTFDLLVGSALVSLVCLALLRLAIML